MYRAAKDIQSPLLIQTGVPIKKHYHFHFTIAHSFPQRMFVCSLKVEGARCAVLLELFLFFTERVQADCISLSAVPALD